MPREPGMRADARRNRDQIVAAALELFREVGIDVPMDEVARRAGVGVGTLYRRFPDRDSLVQGAAHASLRDQVELAQAALREEPDGWSALCRFLRACVGLRHGALASAIEPRLHNSLRTDPALREARQRLVTLIDQMTDAAKAEGALRRDVGRDEVGLLMTLQVYTPPNRSADKSARRVLDLALDGMLPHGK